MWPRTTARGGCSHGPNAEGLGWVHECFASDACWAVALCELFSVGDFVMRSSMCLGVLFSKMEDGNLQMRRMGQVGSSQHAARRGRTPRAASHQLRFTHHTSHTRKHAWVYSIAGFATRGPLESRFAPCAGLVPICTRCTLVDSTPKCARTPQCGCARHTHRARHTHTHLVLDTCTHKPAASSPASRTLPPST